ncbi:MAG: PAS domain-containing protein [Nitrosomonadales bacterium]|nr:PAS domain-containing protein [Nitrosomonadales bacterium]
MSGTGHVLHIELGADCTPDVARQLSPRLSTLIHRAVTSTAILTKVLQEENWDAIVCSNTLLATNTLHSFLANLPGMACQIRLDADNRLHLPYVSEGCSALLGIAPLEVELHPELLLGMLHPEDRDMFYKSMQESIAQPTPWNWEGRIVLPPNGEIKWVNLRATCREADSHGTVWEGFMVNITQNKLAEQEIRASRQRLRELTSHVENIKEEERGRIARDLHDEIGVLLTALKMDMAWLAQRLPQGGSALHEKVQAMTDLLDTASSFANNLVHSLRPAFLDCFGIVAAIEIEAKEFTKRTGIPCKITKSDDDIELPGEQSIALFRVFQETLSNIMKHAAAKQVHIEILKTGKCVYLAVSDDGKGFDKTSRNKPLSFGLRGIQERIKHLGGDVGITSEPGKGTQIAVSVPLNNTDRTLNNVRLQQASYFDQAIK